MFQVLILNLREIIIVGLVQYQITTLFLVFALLFRMDLGIMNIFHNNGPNYGVVYIEEGARVVIQGSIFDNNANILFYIYSGFLNLMNS